MPKTTVLSESEYNDRVNAKLVRVGLAEKQTPPGSSPCQVHLNAVTKICVEEAERYVKGSGRGMEKAALVIQFFLVFGCRIFGVPQEVVTTLTTTVLPIVITSMVFLLNNSKTIWSVCCSVRKACASCCCAGKETTTRPLLVESDRPKAAGTCPPIAPATLVPATPSKPISSMSGIASASYIANVDPHSPTLDRVMP